MKRMAYWRAAKDAIPKLRTFVSVEPMLGALDTTALFERGGIDWVICGGESGPNARPMHPDWARKLRDDCADAEVPFFFKQWGEYAPLSRTDGVHELPFGEYDIESRFGFMRLGKHAAGRLLDGVEHNALPAYWPANVGLIDVPHDELVVLGEAK